jgi:hypothetical protein
MRDEKIGINCQFQEKLFIIFIFHFELVKARMNALHFCKLRKDCLSGSGHGTIVLTKCLYFFIFQLPKAEQRPFVHLPGGVEFPKLR